MFGYYFQFTIKLNSILLFDYLEFEETGKQ